MKTITYTLTNQTMGDGATPADADKWAQHVTKRLGEKYPAHVVAVIVNCRLSADVLTVQSDWETEESVSEFIGTVWDNELCEVFP